MLRNISGEASACGRQSLHLINVRRSGLCRVVDIELRTVAKLNFDEAVAILVGADARITTQITVWCHIVFGVEVLSHRRFRVTSNEKWAGKSRLLLRDYSA
jgi:hypothetical protein